MPPKFLEYIVILCFERRDPKQNSVFRLKSNILPPQHFWAGYAADVSYNKMNPWRVFSRSKEPRCGCPRNARRSLKYFGKQKLIRFPSSGLVKCWFSVVVELLRAKRNKLEISKCDNLRLKLTKPEPRIKGICYQH